MSDELHNEILDGFDTIMQRLQGAPFLLNSGYPVAQSADAVMQGKADPNAMKASFTIVTRGSGVNRQGNKLRIAPTDDGNGQGLSLDNYKTNPVCFLDHGQRGLTLPIGVSEDKSGNNTVKLYQSKADADIYFSQTLPEAVQVFGLVDEGILRTASISFMPRRAVLVKTKRMDGQKTQGGDDVIDMSPGRWGSFDFIDSDMLEWSIVGIPADAGAVRKFLERGKIGTEKITQGMKYALNQMAEAPAPWVPVSQSSDVSRLENIFETWMTKATEILDQFGRVVSQAKETTGESDTDDTCATCGKPASNHNVRHPFKSSKKSQSLDTEVDAPADEITTPAVEQGFDAAAFAASVTESMKQSLDASLAPLVQKQEALEQRLSKALGKVD